MVRGFGGVRVAVGVTVWEGEGVGVGVTETVGVGLARVGSFFGSDRAGVAVWVGEEPVWQPDMKIKHNRPSMIPIKHNRLI